MCAFLNVHSPAMLNLRTNPPGYVLSCRVKREQLIKIAMVKITVYPLLYLAEIHHHTLSIQLTGTAMYSYDPIMSVQTCALALIGKLQSV